MNAARGEHRPVLRGGHAHLGFVDEPHAAATAIDASEQRVMVSIREHHIACLVVQREHRTSGEGFLLLDEGTSVADGGLDSGSHGFSGCGW